MPAKSIFLNLNLKKKDYILHGGLLKWIDFLIDVTFSMDVMFSMKHFSFIIAVFWIIFLNTTSLVSYITTVPVLIRCFRALELREHAFFKGVDWNQVYHQKYPPPLIPPRGEVNAADAFDIGSFDEEDTKGIKVKRDKFNPSYLTLKWVTHKPSIKWHIAWKTYSKSKPEWIWTLYGEHYCNCPNNNKYILASNLSKALHRLWDLKQIFSFVFDNYCALSWLHWISVVCSNSYTVVHCRNC